MNTLRAAAHGAEDSRCLSADAQRANAGIPRSRAARSRSSLASLLLALLAIVATLLPAAVSTAAVDAAQIQSLSELLSNDSSLSDDKRAALSSTLQAASAAIQKSADERLALSDLQEQLSNGEATIADFKARVRDIQNAPSTIQRRIGTNPDLATIVAEVASIDSQRAAWSRDRKQALDAMANTAKTEASLRDRMTVIAENLHSANKSIVDTADASLELLIAKLAAEVRREALAAEEERIKTQLSAATILNNVRAARVAWLDASTAEVDALLGALRNAAAELRQSAAMQLSSETRRMLAQLDVVPAPIGKVADANLQLIQGFQTLAESIASTRVEIADTRQTTEHIDQDSALTQRRLEVAGLESRLGQVMLTRLASLPDSRFILSRSRKRNDEIAAVSISAIDTEQDLRGLGDQGTFYAALMGEAAAFSALEKRTATQLYDQRRDLLQENLTAQNTLLRLLVDSNQATAELAKSARSYKSFLTGNLLWVRNYAYADPARLLDQLRNLGELRPVATVVWQWPDLLGDSSFLLLLALLLILLLRHRKIRGRLKAMLSKPIRPRNESATLVLQALGLTFLRALPLPLLLILLAQGFNLLGSNLAAIGFQEALQWAGLVMLPLVFMDRLSDRHGAGRRLLKWNSQKVDLATRDLSWGRMAIMLALMLTVYGRGSSPTDSGGPLAAIGSLSAAVVMLIVFLRLLRSRQFDADALTRLFLRIALAVSAAVIFMHLSGQLFAAHLYLLALGLSIATVVITLLFSNILQRILLIHRGHLERQARAEKREREREASSDEASENRADSDEDTEDVTSLSSAYSQLLNLFRLLTIGSLLWLIWSPALPALSVFDSIVLWSTEDVTLPVGELRNITVSTLLLSALTIIVTFLLTRHLPPLIKVFLIEWSAVSPGSRYATGMLMQYLILGIGLSIALAMLGFQWSKVQWLVAALGVGIGFGLQEIVANFISGLIVLFERPIRVGDIIHAGGADGTVTRINARATVIETFEGKELLIPNKELITNVVTNWSLSSPKLRIVIPIGIAYGSDVGEAMRLLVQVARANPEVLAEPDPVVTFEDFGDNALVLWLRCFAQRDYPRVASELRKAIYEEFNAAAISISFPQRDVHLDAHRPIPIRLVSEPEKDR
ncbi:MAG: potassium efflux system protein [Halieaceae bacterium]|jgi:potassium efflux system protein